MKNLNIKSFVWAIVFISACIWFVIASFNGLNLSTAKDLFGTISQVVTFDWLIIFLFIKWGWKLRIFSGWLVPFPNLNGTWFGNIKSSWVDPKTNNKIDPIPVMLTIKQSFFHVSCIMQTKEMRSDSCVEGFTIDQEKQVKRLTYTYTSRPKTFIQERSRIHDGTITFEIIENYRPETPIKNQKFWQFFTNKTKPKLSGAYWTERKTTGEIEMIFEYKDLLEEIPSDFPKHPMNSSK